MNGIRIGTRGSELALWQANRVASNLQEVGHATELRIIRTTGDRHIDVPLASIGGKGMFIRELEEALLRDEIDLAVHSLKDVPSIVPEEFTLAGFLERGDPRDAWFHSRHESISELERGARVGTSSPRRGAQLRALVPHIELVRIRGNVPTRLEKMRRGDCNGLVLAAAGVRRLGLQAQITSLFDIDEMVPAAGQGIVAIETLRTRSDLAEIASQISDRDAALAARCERGVLQHFGTLLDCDSSVAVHAEIAGDAMRLRAFFSDLDGQRAIREEVAGSRNEAEDLVRRLAGLLEEKGAQELLEARPA